ncbi:MAG: alanine racemase [Myxococcales bacterium]|nr:alanine racemase [Myxococcales bacterium]USN51338.1 MAG: alanine racemase [Myxococcales bacterium]
MYRSIALINRQALLKNLAFIEELTMLQPMIVMVKANAYGHGLLQIASILNDRPGIAFGVAALKEARSLRAHGIKNQIFLFDGGAFVGKSKDIFRYKITPVISSIRALRDITEFATHRKQKISVHLKFDTGFIRNGFDYQKLLMHGYDEEFKKLKNHAHIEIEGVATHFCMADDLNSDFTDVQIKRFEQCLDYLLDNNISFNYVHFANSATLLRKINLSERFAHLQLLNRPGLLLYGYSPFDNKSELIPVMSIKSQIIAIKEIPPQTCIGYGHTYHAPTKRRVAILAIGYGDGISRRLSNQAKVLIKGQEAPIIGTISMDSCAVDISDIPEAQEGEMATLIGNEDNKCIKASDWALICNTIVWEILTSITARLDRIVI